MAVLNPNGSLVRRFPAPSKDGKRQFAFAAEGTGVYLIQIAPQDARSGKYELLVDKILSLNERLQPEARSDPFPSPRIEALRSQIVSGQSNTEPFWKQVSEQGTPLIESYGSDDRYQLVTFLWRGQYETRNVLVRGSFQGPGTELDNVMHRIANSDVWYLTLRLPKAARFWYRLSPNDPLTFDGPRAAQRSATSQADPLNPRRWDCAAGDTKYACNSTVELPGAIPQRCARAAPLRLGKCL